MDASYFIHLFKTKENFYIYDVNTNAILKVSEEIYGYLDNQREANNCDYRLEGQIEKIINSGYLSKKRVDAIEHPYDELLPFYLKNRLNVITLQVTQQCNLRCSYCSFSGIYNDRVHSDKQMSLEVAKKGIDFMISNSLESPRLDVGFYGGEPLLRFDLIKECVSYAKQQGQGKEVTFHMTTNGTLLRDEVVDFLVENNFKLLISIDGPEEIHDKNRRFASNNKGTFRIIMNNVKNIKSKYPSYAEKNISFSAVLDGTTDFKCTKDFFANYEEIKDFRVNASMISNSYSNANIEIDENYLIQQRYERFKIFLNRIGRLEEKDISSLFEKEFDNLKIHIHERKLQKELNQKEHPGGPCLPGVRKLFMDINGVFYPCERVSELSEPMKIGNISDGLDVNKIRNILNIGQLSEDQCKNCWAYRFCYLCASHADDLSKFSKEKKLGNCRNVRYSTEEKFKDYCTLIEFGHNFNEPDFNYLELLEGSSEIG
ncbi:Cys-rich peptide radical SAM maturase CcpM [Wukongibacter baidiensis]|uniref:Cys-rich peptide radical SAM maturase CcpM n=1 Tax=Wukongibacter baidiensis TaxID=1723361 RepID=UPI003D7FA375